MYNYKTVHAYVNSHRVKFYGFFLDRNYVDVLNVFPVPQWVVSHPSACGMHTSRFADHWSRMKSEEFNVKAILFFHQLDYCSLPLFLTSLCNISF